MVHSIVELAAKTLLVIDAVVVAVTEVAPARSAQTRVFVSSTSHIHRLRKNKCHSVVTANIA